LIPWKQKSRETWITYKDLSTKYFHASTIKDLILTLAFKNDYENWFYIYNRNEI
jgi:hypothetical protein